VRDVETLAKWLRDATTVNLVCCLGAGCVARFEDKQSSVWLSEDALSAFAQCVGLAVDTHAALARHLRTITTGYRAHGSPALYWDESGFDHPGWYRPTDDEEAARESAQSRGRTGE
jgi:hypothetical protein